ncbi:MULTISPECIES: hypothetical protein [unclassified Brevundimonas]|uniref:hypothetical protein n=1 Tax=unclassified Brevundimonas TaxID=2622653 RepID=UPI0025B7BA2E|nr:MULTISPECIES: hypothetical protein [unclassified Brevundimonas]
MGASRFGQSDKVVTIFLGDQQAGDFATGADAGLASCGPETFVHRQFGQPLQDGDGLGRVASPKEDQQLAFSRVQASECGVERLIFHPAHPGESRDPDLWAIRFRDDPRDSIPTASANESTGSRLSPG